MRPRPYDVTLSNHSETIIETRVMAYDAKDARDQARIENPTMAVRQVLPAPCVWSRPNFCVTHESRHDE